MLCHIYLVLTVLLCISETSLAQNCEDRPSTAVIVVASVFGTLAVVFIILGIIGLLLWKRKRDISRPPQTPTKNNHLQEVRGDYSPDVGMTNPAFTDAEITLAEQGVSYVHCRDNGSPEKKKSPKSSDTKDAKRKTWTSFAGGDVPPGLNRNGSVGSLDNHFQSMGPEVTSVWLQSQDFIGLGFNIAGSMRDGIFVSQVHNRGPAVESGKFKVGDRILSVTISFENMVYEDALTILSYASPYPVKVTLQKELGRKDQRSSNSNLRLTHPLYRSQSVDTLLNINREPLYTPAKRSLSVATPVSHSDLFPPTKVSKATLKLKTDPKFEPKENTQKISTAKVSDNSQKREVTPSEIQIHTEVFSLENEKNNDKSPSPPQTVVSQAKLNLKTDPSAQEIEDELPSGPPPQIPITPVPESIIVVEGNRDLKSHEFSDVFDGLNEEDKLDMLRLSYEDPDSRNNSVVVVPTDSSTKESPKPPSTLQIKVDAKSDYVNVEPKSPPPVKPERRKKKGSTDSSESSANTPRSEDGNPIEDIINQESVASVESAPDSAIAEDSIIPEKSDRKIIIDSEVIDYSQINTSKVVQSDSPDLSRTLVDYSLSDMESTIRPQSPDTSPPVEEEFITPVQRKQEPHLLTSSSLPNDDSSILQTSNNESSTGSDKEENTTIEFEKNCSALDFNIDSNPNLFSTPFPNRHTKETVNGVSYDISVVELDAMESEVKRRTTTTNEPVMKRGTAFEVRDDVVQGFPVNVESKTNIPRAVSYHESPDSVEMSIQKLRAGSLKDDRPKSAAGAPNDSMEWSGKRLVRSGSFTDIPQNESVSDWTDQAVQGEEESTLVFQDSMTSSEESLISTEKPGLARSTNLFRARENLANLSDNSDSSVVTSSKSSSRSSTPPPPYTANGENEIIPSPETTPTKTSLNIRNSQQISTDIENNEVNKAHQGNGDFNVGEEEDTDC